MAKKKYITKNDVNYIENIRGENAYIGVRSWCGVVAFTIKPIVSHTRPETTHILKNENNVDVEKGEVYN